MSFSTLIKIIKFIGKSLTFFRSVWTNFYEIGYSSVNYFVVNQKRISVDTLNGYVSNVHTSWYNFQNILALFEQ